MRRVLLAAFVAAAFVAGPAPPAQAHNGEHASEVGWWTATPGAAAQPDGGFEVAVVAGQPVSVAALRFAGAGSATTAKLTLAEADGGVGAAASLRVCVTSSPWQPANPGAMADAPEADCSSAVDLTRDADAKTWTAEVGSLLSAGSLMVVPGEAPAGGAPVDPGFRVVFSEAALEVTTVPPPAVEPAPLVPDAGSFPTPSDSFAPAFSPAAAAPLYDSFSPAGVPVAPAPQQGEAPASEETFGGSTVTAAGDGDGGGGGGSRRPWGRLLLFVPLSAGAGVASVFTRRLLAERGVIA